MARLATATMGVSFLFSTLELWGGGVGCGTVDVPDGAPTRTSGVYTCASCQTGQSWTIDENHVLYWDGAPHIPHAINDFPLIYRDINEIIDGIDFLIDNGTTDLAFGSYEASSINTTGTTRAALDAKLKQVIEHIENRGGIHALSIRAAHEGSLSGDDRPRGHRLPV
jgi:hypothetical protein